MKRGSGLPRPNGPSAPSRAARPGESALTWSAPSSVEVGQRPAGPARARARAARSGSARARRPASAAQRQARRHRMAAALEQEPVLARGDHRACRDRSPAPSVPSPCRCRPSMPITTAGRWWRSTRRAATRPTTPGDQPSPATQSSGASARERRAELRLGGGEHLALERAALLVELLHRGRRAAAISSGSSLSRRSAARREQPVRPPALIARPEHEAEVLGAERRGAGAPRAASAARPGIGAARRDLEPLGDQRAVEALERHHVAHRAERHEVEPAAQVGLGPRAEMAARAQRAVERDDDQERHADRGEVASPGSPGRSGSG